MSDDADELDCMLWCESWNGGACDCDKGRCPECGAIGPCAIAGDGTPLICRVQLERGTT